MADPVVRAVNRGLSFQTHLVGVKFDFEPSIAISAKAIDKLGMDFTDFRVPLATAIKTVMIPSFRQNFAEEGRPDHWDPLAPYTVKLRGTDGPILHRTGRLQSAATSFDIWSVNDTTATIRSLPGDTWYGYLHQAGWGGFEKHFKAARARLGKGAKEADVRRLAFSLSDQGGKKNQKNFRIPARPFILIQEQDEENVADVFYEWMGLKAKEAGFK